MTSAKNEYASYFDEYWSRPERIGETSADLGRVAEQLVAWCGFGKVLDVGCGEGLLVSELIKRGVDAFGIDVSQVAVDRALGKLPGRFQCGSALDLPYDIGAFDTVVSTHCLEHLAPDDVPAALREICRISKRWVFLQVATNPHAEGRGHSTAQSRAWWEQLCFEAGLRKHPAYYMLNHYHALNHESAQARIPLEKIPAHAVDRYPLAALDNERGLHMDMSRVTGERSDAHMVRYQWATSYIRPGDRVLDAACGLGYGSHMIHYFRKSAAVTAVDGSETAIEYAEKSFASDDGQVRFLKGDLPEVLSRYENGSFDAVVCMETLEHVNDPEALLLEFHRLLTPGGRIIASVPNDWSDETGKDPNPHHLHVYDWATLKKQLSSRFVLENAYQQTASQCKIAAEGGKWALRPRNLQEFSLDVVDPPDCEWCLITAMKSPLEPGPAYVERPFGNIRSSGHPSVTYNKDYQNPWLVHAMVNSGYRLKSPKGLEDLARRVLSTVPRASFDFAAALCVVAYRVLERPDAEAKEASEILALAEIVLSNSASKPLDIRWKTSLLFVKGLLLQRQGNFPEAIAAFEACAAMDVRSFGIHLATKVTEASFLAGKLACGMGDADRAARIWTKALAYGEILLSASLRDVLINTDFPNRFNHGDGIREYTLAWDNLARCANGVHLLRVSPNARELDYQALNNSIFTEYAGVTGDLLECRAQLSVCRQELAVTQKELIDRTKMLEISEAELVFRTKDLVEQRKTLAERTVLLEKTSGDLVDRTRDLVATRVLLIERTEALEKAAADLIDRTADLVNTRSQLIERTEMLEQRTEDIAAQDAELERARSLILQSRDAIEQLREDHVEIAGRIADVEGQSRHEREQLAIAHGELLERTNDLVETRATLAERSVLLERTGQDLVNRTEELVSTRRVLAERTDMLERATAELSDCRRELEELRKGVLARIASALSIRHVR